MTNSKSLVNSSRPRKDDRAKIAAIYARVSSGSQVFGFSLDEQIRLGRERCNMMGWKVSYIFREDGESAGTMDRPKFQAMIERAKQQNFDVLVFWKLDRFCRSLMDVINVEKQLKNYGVSLHSITEQIDTTTSAGRFNFRNIASAAEWERDMIKERSRMGMKGLAMQGRWPNRLPPLGYDKDSTGHLTINKEESEVVKLIFKRYIKIKSMPQLAYDLNQQGITTRRGKKWSARVIKYILDNELYIGKYNVAEIEREMEDLRIITNNLFQKAQAVRHRNTKKPMPKTRKQCIVDKMMNNYINFLEEMELHENDMEKRVHDYGVSDETLWPLTQIMDLMYKSGRRATKRYGPSSA